MNELETLKAELKRYQEGYNEADTAGAKAHYRKLCNETYARIEEIEQQMEETQ